MSVFEGAARFSEFNLNDNRRILTYKVSSILASFC